MPALYRAFKEDFRQHLLGTAWPNRDALKAWLHQEQIKGRKNDPYSQLRQGGEASETFIRAMLEYLSRDTDPDTDDPEARRGWAALRSYLETNCRVSDPEHLSIHAIMDHVCKPSCNSPRRKPPNWFIAALFVVRDLYEISRAMHKQPWKYVKLCSKDDPATRAQQVSEAVEWLFVVLGRDFGQSDQLSVGQAISKAEERLQTTFAQYKRQAIDWCDFERWSVVRCFDGRQLAGMSIVLPLRQEPYQAVRSGQRLTHSCVSSDMVPLSSHLLVEACAERLSPNGLPPRRFSLCSVMAMICQEVWLSTVPGIGDRVPLHLLAPAGTVENTRRLKWSGYQFTGTHVCGMPDVNIMERRFTIRESGIRKPFDASLLGSWLRLQNELRSPEAQAWLEAD